MDKHYEEILRHLNLDNLTVHGQYQPGELQTLLSGMDVAIHASIWPETYCIALSEAWINDLVPVVTDIGALGERVVEGKNGWKIPVDNPGALLDRLRRLAARRDLVDTGFKTETLIETEDAHVGKLESIYDALTSGKPSSWHRRPEFEAQESRLTLFEAGLSLNDETRTEIFQLSRDAFSILRWTSFSGYPRGKAGTQRAITHYRNLQSPDTQKSESVDSLIEELRVRCRQLEHSLAEERRRVDDLYQSRIWRTLCRAGAAAQKIESVLGGKWQR